jgi:hypothetical protein
MQFIFCFIITPLFIRLSANKRECFLGGFKVNPPVLNDFIKLIISLKKYNGYPTTFLSWSDKIFDEITIFLFSNREKIFFFSLTPFC